MKKFIAFVISAMMLITVCANAQYSGSELINTVNSAIEWKEENASPYYNPASEAADLYITALKRLGMNYDYTVYSDSLQTVLGAYDSDVSAAAYSRAIMALQACDIDAEAFNDRDYVAEGTYAKGNISGVDNWSWALIALNSGDYDVPDWAYDTREDMIKYIMANQNDDGSFGDGAASTALAIIALEDYTYDDIVYTYVSDITGKDRSTSVIESVNLGLEYLSAAQSDWGDYYDLKSTALTLIALDYMDVDAEKDDRFIKDGQTVLDGLMVYQEADGGFSSELNGSDSTATSYAICALTSHLRQMQGKGKLFDFLSNDVVDGIKQINNSGNGNNNSVNSSSSNSGGSSNNSTSSSSSSNSGSSSNNSTSSSSSSNSGSSSNNSTSSSSSSNSGSSSNSTTSGSSSSATKAPSISSVSTAKPKATMKPISSPSVKVASTTRPASTMAPITSPRPASTPRATTAPKKKALVGPVEMTGPMMQTPEPTINPSIEPVNAAAAGRTGGISNSLPIGITMLALAALITAAAVTYVIYTGKNIPERKKSRGSNDRYEAKVHRQTEIHGRYKARERYKERGKYKGSYRK